MVKLCASLVAVQFILVPMANVWWQFCSQVEGSSLEIDPEVYMDATQLITSKGYPCENHYVTTEDGYILNVLRIPHGRDTKAVEGPRPPVILQHGLLVSCTCFLENLVNESLAFILADAGADVWLPNSRGTSYSRKHKRLNPDYMTFWDFSYDEMARYDLPAVVQFIVSKSGVDKLYYVGHSQGSTIGLIAFGENQKVASHIKHFFALSPIARIGHNKSLIRMLVPVSAAIKNFLDIFGHGELVIAPDYLRLIAGNLCNEWGFDLCGNIVFLYGGFSGQSFNMSRLPVYAAHSPESTSAKAMDHWFQGMNSKEFRQYDYGYSLNLYRSGQGVPPSYDPSKVKVPVTLFYGGNDWLATPIDVSWLIYQLNITEKVYIDSYSHADFVYGVDAPQLVYRNIVRTIFA